MSRLPKRATKKPTGTGRRAWPAQVREQALALYAEVGAAEARKATGVPGPTIRRWAREAGVDHAAANAAAVARAAAATEASLAARARLIAEGREQLAQQMLQRALEATALERDMLKAHADALSAALRDGLGAMPAPAVARLEVAKAGHSLAEIVGVRTRAIHDLNLLEGKPTEQPTGGLTVVFSTPAPAVTQRPTHLSIVDLPPEDDVADAELA